MTDRPIIIVAAGSDTIAGQLSVSMQSPSRNMVLHAYRTNLWTL